MKTRAASILILLVISAAAAVLSACLVNINHERAGEAPALIRSETKEADKPPEKP